MNLSTKQLSINPFYLVSIIILSCCFISENVFSQKYWNRRFTKVICNPVEKSVTIKSLVFDYYFGPNFDRAYLKTCDFFYSIKPNEYIHLMCIETWDQVEREHTVVKMRFKSNSDEIQFLECFKPENASMWPNDNKDVFLYVKNEKNTREIKYTASVTVKWFLGDKYRQVKFIRLIGIWKVKGSASDVFRNIDYQLPNESILKSEVIQYENNRVKVAAKAGELFITGTYKSEKIKVYNKAGEMVGSNVTSGDVSKIQLPKKQIYTVIVGQTPYKVTL